MPRRSAGPRVRKCGTAVFAICVLFAPSARAEPETGFAPPPPGLLDELRRQHHPGDWLFIAADSTRLEVRVREIGDDGLNGLKARHWASRAPDRIAWSSISRIDLRESRFRHGQIAGFVVGGLAGIAALAKNYADTSPAYGLALGVFPGIWIGGKYGDQFVSRRPLYEAPASPAPPSPAVAPDRVADSARVRDADTWAIWLTPQIFSSWPVGDFRPAGQEPARGAEFQASFVPAHPPIGARLAAGRVSYRSRHGGLTAPVFGSGLEVSLLEVTTRTDVDWAMVGPQWDPNPHDSGVYLYATMGLVRVKPQGSAPWGRGPLGVSLTYGMPGLPPGSLGFASSAGAGARAVFGKGRSLALTTELEYRHGATTDYIGAPGVEGSFPDTRFSARHGAIETVTFRLGLAASWDRRTGAPR